MIDLSLRSMKKIPFRPPTVLLRGFNFFRSHPFTTNVIASLLYLLLFQAPFITTGDAWAESWYEYIHGAFVNGWSGFFQLGIAGYFNFLPKLLSYPFVILHLPLEYIDYFFRFVVVAYVIGCTAFVAHPYNRQIIKSDFLRSVLALALLLCFNHITVFSMINAWYVGFVPIVLVSLSPHRFKNELRMVLYAIFALAVSLTKPSIILLPFALYRAIRHKEYLLGFIVSFGIVLQTLLLLTSSYLSNLPAITADIVERGVNTLLYPGLLFLKSFGIPPSSLLVIILASLLIVSMVYLSYKKIGVLRTGLLALVIMGAAYTSLYAPDSPAPSLAKDYSILFSDDQKLQRELIVRLMLLVLLFISLGWITEKITASKRLRAGTLACAVLVLLPLYRPIDVTSAALTTDLSPFRQELKNKTIDCIPVAPNVLWGVKDKSEWTYPWYFERGQYGACGRINYAKSFHLSSFTTKISETPEFSITLEKNHTMTAFSLPIQLMSPNSATVLTLTEMKTGKRFTATVSERQSDKMSNPVFNLAGIPQNMQYDFSLSSSNPDVFTGTFDDGTLLFFAYYSLQN